MELCQSNPLLLKDLSLKELKWRRTNKNVLGEEMIIEDEDADFDASDEVFYGRKTMVSAGETMIRKKTTAEIRDDLMCYHKLAMSSGIMN